jgi:hypothetical protein
MLLQASTRRMTEIRLVGCWFIGYMDSLKRHISVEMEKAIVGSSLVLLVLSIATLSAKERLLGRSRYGATPIEEKIRFSGSLVVSIWIDS